MESNRGGASLNCPLRTTIPQEQFKRRFQAYERNNAANFVSIIVDLDEKFAEGFPWPFHPACSVLWEQKCRAVRLRKMKDRLVAVFPKSDQVY